MARKGPRTWRSHAILLPGDNSIGTVSPLGRAVDLPIDCLTSVGLSRYSVPLTNKQALFPNLTKNMTNKVRERMVGGNQKIWLMQQKAPQSMANVP